MPNIWSGRNRPLSVSESHSEDSSPSTETRGAPVKTMTATWCHHAATTITSCVRCTYVNTFIADIFLCCFVLALFKCTHVRLICCKIDIYISKCDEVRKTTSFVKKKIQFPVTETIGWYVLHVKITLVWMCYWFTQTSKKYPVLTHIQPILHSLDDVEGVVHVALQDVKLDIVTPEVIGPVGWHCCSQEDDLWWIIQGEEVKTVGLLCKAGPNCCFFWI